VEALAAGLVASEQAVAAGARLQRLLDPVAGEVVLVPHDVFEELWEVHVGTRYYHLVLEQRIGFPLVHSEVSYQSPLRFGDRPIVRVTCDHLGNSSLGLRYEVLLGRRLCVDAHMRTACVQLDKMTSIRIPDEYRARFERLFEDEEAEA